MYNRYLPSGNGQHRRQTVPDRPKASSPPDMPCSEPQNEEPRRTTAQRDSQSPSGQQNSASQPRPTQQNSELPRSSAQRAAGRGSDSHRPPTQQAVERDSDLHRPPTQQAVGRNSDLHHSSAQQITEQHRAVPPTARGQSAPQNVASQCTPPPTVPPQGYGAPQFHLPFAEKRNLDSGDLLLLAVMLLLLSEGNEDSASVILTLAIFLFLQ